MGMVCSEGHVYTLEGRETNRARMFSFGALSKRRVCACAIAAILACLAITLDLSIPLHARAGAGALSIVREFCQGFAKPDATPTFALMTIGLCFLFLFGFKKQPMRIHWPVVVLSLFFGFAMVFGWVLDNGFDIGVLFRGHAQIMKAAAAFVAWSAIAYAAMTLVFTVLDKTLDGEGTPWLSARESPGKTGGLGIRFLDMLDRNPFALPFAVLVVCWSPVVIGTAPGLFMGDTYTQICMWYGLPHDRLAGAVPLDPAVTWTTHHPVLHTALVGMCVQFGQTVFGNVNVGVAMYALFQVVIDIACIAYAFRVAHQLGVSSLARLVALLFFTFVPWFPTYGVLLTKDTLFADALLLLCLQFVLAFQECAASATGQISARRLALIVVFGILAALLRNGAILFAATGCIAFAVLCMVKGAARRRIVGCTVGMILVVAVFNSLVVPAMGIAPGSKVEVLSIPFQQTARYISEHPRDVSDAEKAAIDAILGYEGLAGRYDPLRSDNVKDYAAPICRDATSADWKAYFDAWANMGMRHPGCYIEATLQNYYGYFYISHHKNQLYRIAWSDKKMRLTNKETGFDFHRFDGGIAGAVADLDSAYAYVFKRVPIISLALNSAFWCWMLLLVSAYAIRRRWKYAVPILSMLWLIMLVFFVGPCNGANYNRYVYPLAFVLPILIMVFPTWCMRHEKSGKGSIRDKNDSGTLA